MANRKSCVTCRTATYAGGHRMFCSSLLPFMETTACLWSSNTSERNLFFILRHIYSHIVQPSKPLSSSGGRMVGGCWDDGKFCSHCYSTCPALSAGHGAARQALLCKRSLRNPIVWGWGSSASDLPARSGWKTTRLTCQDWGWEEIGMKGQSCQMVLKSHYTLLYHGCLLWFSHEDFIRLTNTMSFKSKLSRPRVKHKNKAGKT